MSSSQYIVNDSLYDRSCWCDTVERVLSALHRYRRQWSLVLLDCQGGSGEGEVGREEASDCKLACSPGCPLDTVDVFDKSARLLLFLPHPFKL